MIVDVMGQAAGWLQGLIGLTEWSVNLTTSSARAVAESVAAAPPPPPDDDGLIDWVSRKLREFRVLILLAVWVFVAAMVAIVYVRSKGSWGATLAAIILGAVVLAGVHNMDDLQGDVGAEIDSAPSIDSPGLASR